MFGKNFIVWVSMVIKNGVLRKFIGGNSFRYIFIGVRFLISIFFFFGVDWISKEINGYVF